MRRTASVERHEATLGRGDEYVARFMDSEYLNFASKSSTRVLHLGVFEIPESTPFFDSESLKCSEFLKFLKC